MCGFSGIFTKQKINDAAILRSLAAIKHRGPDNTIHATFSNDFSGFSSALSDTETQEKLPLSDGIESDNWIGFNRLSIMDLSNRGMQPFYDEVTKTAFLFNGEVYNFGALKNEFLQNVEFKSKSDSEVVFQLYLKLGDDFVHHLRGMFAIVVVDYAHSRLKVWRDRFGIKPFYYYLDNHQFVFSSEIKGIFDTNFVEKIIDYQHLAYSFYLNTNFAPNTIYRDAKSLEAATQLTVDLSNFEHSKKTYWTLDYIPDLQSIDSTTFLKDVEEVVQLASMADVKQALMLSGGLDSGLLAYILGKLGKEIDAITIYNEYDDAQNELKFARSNAKNSGMNLLEIEIDNEVDLETIKTYLLAEEEPNICPEVAYFLSEKAHEKKYAVLHSALGLDELFYGYAYYYWAKMGQRLEPMLFKKMKYLLKGKKRYKYEELSAFGLVALPFVMRSTTSWQSIQALFQSHGSSEWAHPIQALLKQVAQTNPSFEKFPLLKQLSYLDFYYYISSHHAMRSDVPSMRHQIEMRFPYLDHLFVQKYFNCSSLDHDLTLKNNKPFLRKAVVDILPEDVLYMPKKGFSMPTSVWLDKVEVGRDFPEVEAVFGDLGEEWMNDPSKKWWIISASLVLKNQK
ncbi:asparagine synthase (glutamine-hydrolyzing) [Vaginella massiliensis]|uniref:asparagine synthase (glutamine-hydrolyzing) n=1 Tax=Vaginella massiliensis TaxID=1816680 RepID=UPI0008393598|nr:asparagine synthase (glutamine-hydrolyzing) [Vaginella massiliensis]